MTDFGIAQLATGQLRVHSLGVIIATAGRKDIVEQTVVSLALRKAIPEILIVVGAEQNDLPDLPKDLPLHTRLLVAPKRGLTIQRNFGIRALPAPIESVAFLDDDMEVHDNYCMEVVKVFRSTPEAAAFSGSVMANGAIVRAAARQLLDGYTIIESMPAFGFYPRRWPGFYGCAMNIRRHWLEVEQFDERLPLYAIGEDCEMGFRLSRHGWIGGSARCPVVHLGVGAGRISEVGMGYAQIINYLYFAHKDVGFPKLPTYWGKLVRLPLVNLFLCLIPLLERRRSVDRKGRFWGNLLALGDVVRGRIEPGRLLRIVKLD